MTSNSDRELEEISHDSARRANELFPARMMTVRAKICLILAALILTVNAGLGLFNTYQVQRTLQCQRRLSVSSTAIATDDRRATDIFINGTAKIKDQKTFNQLLANYNTARKANDARRAKLLATNCN